MRSIPAITWELERTLDGSQKKDILRIRGKWRLVHAEGTGSLETERTGIFAHEVDGQITPTYLVNPRSLEIGILYTGARNQREYYEARQRLLNFVRPNQYRPVRLYVTLPTRQVFYIDIVGNPGAPLSLAQERNHTFLEPVSFIANDPIFTEATTNVKQITLSTVSLVTAPNKATVTVSSTDGSISSDSIRVSLGAEAGSGDPYSGFRVQIKPSSDPDTAYVTSDVGNVTEHNFINLTSETEYNIRAIAYNSGGDGETSSVVNQQTPLYIFSEPPDVSTTPKSVTIDASWSALPTATGYQIRYKLSSDSSYSNWFETRSTSFTIRGLSSRNDYNIQVRGIFTSVLGVDEYGPVTDEDVTTIPHGPPDPPRNVIFTPNSRSRDTIYWENPVGGEPIDHYFIRARSGGKKKRVAYDPKAGSYGPSRVFFGRSINYIQAVGPDGAVSRKVTHARKAFGHERNTGTIVLD